MVVGGQPHTPAASPPGKRSRYSFDMRMGGPQSRFGRGGEKKNSLPLSGIESRSSSPQPSHYTDLAILAPKFDYRIGNSPSVCSIWGSSIQYAPSHSLRPILKLSSDLDYLSQIASSLQVFQLNFPMRSSSPHVGCTSRLSHPPSFVHPKYIW
jgi:hypothetical protein